MENIKKSLNWIKKNELYPDVYMAESASTDPEVIIDGKKVLMFSSNNYLGLANDERVKLKMIEATKKYGMGSGGSRLLSGNIDIHNELEKQIADFKGEESAITFLAGYMANVGVIPALMADTGSNFLNIFKKPAEKNSAIFSDELNHASIIDGCRLAKAERVIYKHKDMSDLENKIKKHKKKNNLIVTDGVFSMDGDIAPLKDIKFLGKKYGIKVMVDDAHASGLLGKNGRGTAEHFNIENVDITMGTFTKAFGGVGGFIAGSKDLIDYLRVTARTYIFSAPIPPAVSAGLIEAIKIASIDNKLRENLWNNVKHVREELKKMGFNILGETNIIPILVGNEKRAVAFSRELFENNVFIPAVRWPAVPEGQARLRLTIMATHEKEQIDHLLNILQKTGKTLGVI
jgi:8-amino-7-oxononanoate synthase